MKQARTLRRGTTLDRLIAVAELLAGTALLTTGSGVVAVLVGSALCVLSVVVFTFARYR